MGHFFFFVSAHLLRSKGRSLRFSPGQGNPHSCLVMLYVGEGSQWEQHHLLYSLLAFSHFPGFPEANQPLLVLIPGWVGLCTFQDPVGLSNELSCEAGSFCCCHLNPHRYFQLEALRLYFPMLEPWVVWSVSLPRCSSQFIRMWIAQLARSCLSHPVLQTPPCHKSSLPSYTALPLLLVWMNVSSLTPWLLDCHRLIFCQFWLVFVFKFVVVLLLVVRGGTACLPTPPPWPNVLSFQFIFLGIDFTYFI